MAAPGSMVFPLLDGSDDMDWVELQVETAAPWTPAQVGLVETLIELVAQRMAVRAPEAEQRAHEELRLSVERFRSLMRQTSAGFFLFEFENPVSTAWSPEEQVDAFYREGVLVECNDAFARMYGLEDGRALAGARLVELHGGSNHPDNRAFLRACVENDYRVTGEVTEEVDREGHKFWLSNDIVGIVEDGHLVRVWGTQTDITDTKRAEEERDHLEAQLIRAQRIEAIGRLAAGIAHDLNNLLVPIIGSAELLREEGRSSDSRQLIDHVLHASQRARDLVRQLLAFGRKQTLKPQPVDLGEVVERFEPLLRRSIPDDVSLEVDRGEVMAVSADVGQIEQVLMNLVVNAAQAMPGGGNVSIEVGMASIDPRTFGAFPAIAPGPHVRLAVHDTGKGMDEVTKAQVFEPFFSTKGELGTGLGLATVHGIVRQHEGVIHVRSTPGEGTTFEVFFAPLAGTAAPIEAPVTPPRSETSGHILVVEDDDAVRVLTGTLLERLGYVAHVAANGVDALAQLDASPGTFDLILTDVVMPDMNGYQLYEEVRARHPDIAIMFMSGYADNVVAMGNLLDRGLQFIEKPFTLDVLERRVRGLLDASRRSPQPTSSRPHHSQASP